MKKKKKTVPPNKTPTSKVRRKVWARGRRAERWAAFYLRLKLYRIVARNLRMPSGEIDIVAKRGALLVFVEVKYRPDMGLARAAVTPRQWQRIEAAATQFVAKRPVLHRCRWRFDVVAMAPYHWPRHVRNVWRSGR